MRANLLDELHKPYVTTARAKGLSEFRLLLKYPGAACAQPVRLDDRLGVSASDQRRGHHRLRAVAADLGTADAAGAAGAGHVSGGRVHPAALLAVGRSACWSPTSCSRSSTRGSGISDAMAAVDDYPHHRRGRARVAMAADVGGVPPPQAGDDRRRASCCCSTWSALFAEIPGAVRSRRQPLAGRLPSAAAAASDRYRSGRKLEHPALRLRHEAGPRSRSP